MRLSTLITNIAEQDPKQFRTTLFLLLVVATALVYAQVGTFQFINYDDHLFVFNNPHVYTGISLANSKWAFTTLHGDTSYWHPLTWLSLQLDCQLFGLRPGSLHLTNLMFHLANTSLLFVLFDKMTQRIWCSFFVAALFAFHPLHIETVAWISERKSLLCTFFWLLTIWAYLRYVVRPGVGSYLLVALLYAASLMSKPMAVTLPFTLLLLDFWPLNRFGLPGLTPAQTPVGLPRFVRKLPRGNLWPLLLEKLPFLILAGIVSWLTVKAQSDLGALAPAAQCPFNQRLQNALIAYFTYIRKMIWPVDLAVIYPVRYAWTFWQVGGCALFLGCVSLALLRLARRHPYGLVGWLWYLGTLVPVIGLVQAGSQETADRYTYIPLIGLFFGLVWSASETFGNIATWRPRLVAASAFLLTLCAISTSLQAEHWKNRTRLFEHAIRVTERNYIAYRTLGLAFLSLTNLPEAEVNCAESLSLRPDLFINYGSLGDVLFGKGDFDGAFKAYARALEMQETQPEPHTALADLFGTPAARKYYDPRKAVEHARRACELTNYRKRKFLVFLADIYLKNDQYREAADVATKALGISFSPEEIRKVNELLERISECETRKQAAVLTEGANEQ